MTGQGESNRRIVLRAHPQGKARSDDFRTETVALEALAPDTFRVRTLWLSVDPMIRIFIDPQPLGGAMPPLSLGSVIPGAAVGEIVESRHSQFEVGDFVEGRFGWQDFATATGAGVRKVDPALASIENALGVLGLPGFTAFAGLHVAGGVKPGETVLVSGAGGAVGSVVGPLVRARGGRAVGIARGAEKCRHLVEHGSYDFVADRGRDDLIDQLRSALPDGAAIYFDNVGGPFFADALSLMARQGRVLISGLMAQYQDGSGATDAFRPDRLGEALTSIMARGLRIEAFSNTAYEALRPAFMTEVGDLIARGIITPANHVENGLDSAPDAFVRLFDNAITGKVLVRM